MSNIKVTLKGHHVIQHRHPELVRWVEDNLTQQEAEVAWRLVNFIIQRYPATADSLNGERIEWTTED